MSSRHPSPSPAVSLIWCLIRNPSLTHTSSLHRPPHILYPILYQGLPNQNIPGIQTVDNGLTKGAGNRHVRKGGVRGDWKEQRTRSGNRVDVAEGTQRVAKDDSLVSMWWEEWRYRGSGEQKRVWEQPKRMSLDWDMPESVATSKPWVALHGCWLELALIVQDAWDQYILGSGSSKAEE